MSKFPKQSHSFGYFILSIKLFHEPFQLMTLLSFLPENCLSRLFTYRLKTLYFFTWRMSDSASGGRPSRLHRDALFPISLLPFLKQILQLFIWWRMSESASGGRPSRLHRDALFPNLSTPLSKTDSSAVHLVENVGVEPTTSCLQSRRSSQLS